MSSRRSFIKRSTAATLTAATAPLILPKLYAQEAPSNRLNVGAIGVGGRGSGIADQAGKLGNIVAVCDVLRPNAERFVTQQSENGHKAEIYTDYREMLDKHKEIDVVTIGTPDHWHVKIAIEAMQAGKHVYCEKPLTMTLAEGQLVQEAVKKYGKTFQVGTQQRSEFDMRFLKAVAIAQSGRLARISKRSAL